MQVFSATTETFLRRVFPLLISIIEDELLLEVRRTRFVFQNKLMPLGVTVFRSNEKLGTFDPHNYQIGLNERLMWESKEFVLKNILRHEMAHYMTYVLYGNTIAHHGSEYRAFCQKYGWGEDVQAARADLSLSNSQIEGDLPTERLILKVKKLLELASSSNRHEAELATIKANQLIIQHNLDLLKTKQNQGFDQETTFLKRILFSKQNSAKMRAIYEALTSFQVALCFHHGQDGVYLEAVGPYANVEMAHYVATFLDHEMELLWSKAVTENPGLRGRRQKNSFFIGIGQGLNKKNHQAQQMSPLSQELIVLERNLQAHKERAYSRLRSSYTSSKVDPLAHHLGKSAGEKLSIRKPIESAKTGATPRLN
ncbi:MAG: hypothetical protein A2X86_15085 [Bdellovibrionales bacterium GWA2_49_15]|nr:MAG: hypothetical protein A2X86_15085 [Bdellovibrionales bacterium GWA2_49_15]HAZ13332.1 hypothetical protein [Bdellovibrionales bacterium]